MKFNKKKIKDLFLIKPNVFEDVRGAFRRSFCSKEMKKVGIDFEVCQGNISENKNKFTMRGFHYTDAERPLAGGSHKISAGPWL